uniref:Uncharacterized protein n=1 Tax=Anguilla anguilla TaxID=7936 RepID=A0A0E9V1A7_ANGAN
MLILTLYYLYFRTFCLHISFNACGLVTM